MSKQWKTERMRRKRASFGRDSADKRLLRQIFNDGMRKARKRMSRAERKELRSAHRMHDFLASCQALKDAAYRAAESVHIACKSIEHAAETFRRRINEPMEEWEHDIIHGTSDCKERPAGILNWKPEAE